MRKLLAGLFLALSTLAASAQCNPPSGWVTQYGTISLGDTLIYGPNCGQMMSLGTGTAGTLPSTHIYVGNLSGIAADYGTKLTADANGLITFTPSGNLMRGFKTNNLATGSYAASDLFGLALNYIFATTAIDANTSTTQIVNALNVEIYPQNGFRSVVQSITGAVFVPDGVVPNTTSIVSPGVVGVLGFARAPSFGGTNTGAGAKGGIFGMNAVAVAPGTGTNLLGVTGLEVDIQTFSGSSMSRRCGVCVVDFQNGTGTSVQGVNYDIGVSVSRSSTTLGFKLGFGVSDYNGSFGLSATGTVIGSINAGNVLNGADFSSLTISGCAYKSTGFCINGTGGGFVTNGFTVNSGGLLVSSGGFTVTGNIVENGTITVTSTSNVAWTIGPNGATNPVVQVDNSVASQANGLKIVGSAAGSAAQIAVISSAASEGLNINSKGTSNIVFQDITPLGNIVFARPLLPSTNGGAPLGSTALSFSNLFLSSGAAINWNNGTYTATQAASVLTLSGDLLWGGAAPTAWTPTFTFKTGGPPTVTIISATYKEFGKLTAWRARINITALGGGSGNFIITAPTAVNTIGGGPATLFQESSSKGGTGETVLDASSSISFAFADGTSLTTGTYQLGGWYYKD